MSDLSPGNSDSASAGPAVALGALASAITFVVGGFVLFVAKPQNEAPLLLLTALGASGLGSWVAAKRAPGRPTQAAAYFGIFFLIAAIVLSPPPAVFYGLCGLLVSVGVGRASSRGAT